VVQNANDQRLGNPRVDLSLRELRGAELESFLERFDFAGLRPHLDAASSARAGRRLRETLKVLDQEQRLVVLRIEDRDTHGLTGDEDAPGSHFRALCKDTLFSHKGTPSAGGSFGLGKSVLWAFSGLSTVVFNSVPRVCPAERRAPRLIARAELSSHTVAAREFAGPGWFGRKVAGSSGERAESVWGLTAATVARELTLPREQTDSGTSILIVGFREPSADSEESVDETARRMLDAARRWFWPAMSIEGRRLSVSLDGRAPVEAAQDEAIAPFVECFKARRTQREALEAAGDVVVRDLSIELPPKRSGGVAVHGEARLLVRLAPEGSRDGLVGHVALFRGAGMVVKYLDKRSLVALGRPFHAVLACGEARQPEAPTDADREVEAFLRLAEPPGHDEWDSTDALKETYQRGYAKALSGLKDAMSQALREVLLPRTDVGTRGPERLMKRFPFGPQGRPGSAPTAFSFSGLSARLEAGLWHFSGSIEPTSSGGRWTAHITLSEVGDGGGHLADVGIVALSADRAQVRLEGGVAHLTVARGVERLRFEGTSEAVATDEGAAVLDLAVTGSREGA